MNEGAIRCYHCGTSSTFSYAHSGFSDEHFFYCNTCGVLAVIDWYAKEYEPFYKKYIAGNLYNPQKEEDLERFKEDTRRMKLEICQYLEACSCGGKFTVDAIPRCPRCKKELEWDKVLDQIERAFGARGYATQNIRKGWHDVWRFAFNKRLVANPWRKSFPLTG